MSATTHAVYHDTSYALALEPGRLTEQQPSELRFRILRADGSPVTAFASVHEKKIHLIVVRRDLTGYWHLHPEGVGEGVWSVRLPALEPGEYQVFADFSPAKVARSFTVGAGLSVDGVGEPRPLPEPATVFAVGDYDVRLAGNLESGRSSRLEFSVLRDGQPVTDLQPYLGAYGHLVAVGAGDLTYVHVHPDGEPGDGVTPSGPDIAFHAHVADAGVYRLFLDFQHGNVVRTAGFTVVAE
jgi:hypothetical protein